MLDQNALVPLYEQLKDAIKEDIKAKIYCPGDRMPSEVELEEKYQVSRITVRRAVKELCEEEILVRLTGWEVSMIPWKAREGRSERKFWKNQSFM